MRSAANRSPLRVVGFLEDRVVRRGACLFGPAVRVVVEGDGLAGHRLGTGKRRRMAVERGVGGVEDDRAIEERQHPLGAAAHVPVPELEVTAVLRQPVLVEVDDEVEAEGEGPSGMPVEVGVDLEEAAARDLVRSGAAEIGVGDQALDTGQLLQELEDRRGAHLEQKGAQGLAERFLVAVAELLLGGVVELHPMDRLRPRHLGEHRVEDVVGEEAVEHGVREGRRRDVGVVEAGGVEAKLERRHGSRSRGTRERRSGRWKAGGRGYSVSANLQLRQMKLSGAGSRPYTMRRMWALPGPGSTSRTLLPVRSPTTTDSL